jgi:hypothetical protein
VDGFADSIHPLFFTLFPFPFPFPCKYSSFIHGGGTRWSGYLWVKTCLLFIISLIVSDRYRYAFIQTLILTIKKRKYIDMKYLSFLILFFLCYSTLSAQTAADALRFSYFDVSGTARTIGVGGALGALGADYSVASTNPAGLAMYRTSEFIISPSMFFSTVDARLDGTSNIDSENKSRFNFSSIAYVIHSRPSSAASKWKTSNIAIGVNQIANFSQTLYFSGVSTGSINDRFLELAYDENGNGLLPDNLDAFEGGLAFTTGAIYDPDGDYTNGAQWINDFQLIRDVEVYKEQLINRRGAINELNFSVSGNYNERLMIGASVGLPFVNYEEEKTYVEEDPGDEVPAFEQTTFTEDLTTSGIGVNLKLGLIFRVSQALRLGAAVHTPTSYTLTDNFSTELTYIFDQGNGPEAFSDESPAGTFEYKLKSPWRYIGSLGYIIQKKGFLSAEIEYVNYSGANFNLTANSSSLDDAAYEEELNDEISGLFTSSLNIKLGGEYAYDKFRFRAGYTIYGTPYADGDNTDTAISLGVGLRLDKFYVDLAFRRLMQDEVYSPYVTVDPSRQQFVNNSINNDRVALTFGFKF